MSRLQRGGVSNASVCPDGLVRILAAQPAPHKRAVEENGESIEYGALHARAVEIAGRIAASAGPGPCQQALRQSLARPQA